MTKKKPPLGELLGSNDEEPFKPQPYKLAPDKTWAHSFESLGKAFMQAQGGKGFVIVRDGSVYVHQSVPGQYKPTPRAWGAWRRWRKDHHLKTHFMDKQGYWTVPSQWPHEFDADWPEHKSHDAANRWQDHVEAKGRREPGQQLRYLTDPNLSIEDCPRLAAAYPLATTILERATATQLRAWVKEHAYGRPIPELGGKAKPIDRPRIATPFRPFPKLWAAFAAEPEIIELLDHAPSFEWIERASLTFVRQGKDAARGVIKPEPTRGLDAMRDEMSGKDAPDLPPREEPLW